MAHAKAGASILTAACQRLLGVSRSGEAVPFFRRPGNSVFLSIALTAGRVPFDSMAGYALARLNFPGRRQRPPHLLADRAATYARDGHPPRQEFEARLCQSGRSV